MTDITFDIVARDMVLDNTGDFVISSNPSIQNGGIIEFSRCAFITNPMLGIGLESVINANSSKTAYEMNRWQNQVVQDGATVAKWTSTISQTGANNNVNITTDISYE